MNGDNGERAPPAGVFSVLALAVVLVQTVYGCGRDQKIEDGARRIEQIERDVQAIRARQQERLGRP